jgi:hypothetical protein
MEGETRRLRSTIGSLAMGTVVFPVEGETFPERLSYLDPETKKLTKFTSLRDQFEKTGTVNVKVKKGDGGEEILLKVPVACSYGHDKLFGAPPAVETGEKVAVYFIPGGMRNVDPIVVGAMSSTPRWGRKTEELPPRDNNDHRSMVY